MRFTTLSGLSLWRVSALACATIAVVVASASAQPPQGRGGRRGGQRGGLPARVDLTAQAVFEQIDADENDSVSRDEFVASVWVRAMLTDLGGPQRGGRGGDLEAAPGDVAPDDAPPADAVRGGRRGGPGGARGRGGDGAQRGGRGGPEGGRGRGGRGRGGPVDGPAGAPTPIETGAQSDVPTPQAETEPVSADAAPPAETVPPVE
jgi:hypothetical protein